MSITFFYKNVKKYCFSFTKNVTLNRRWLMKEETKEGLNDVYYERLMIRDRLIDKLIEKYGNLSRASVVFGRSRSFLYNYGNLYRLKNIYELCKLSNTSLEWVLTGENDGRFEEVEITFKNILREYYSQRKKRESSSEGQIVYKINHGLISNINISTLLKIQKSLKKSIYYLIQG